MTSGKVEGLWSMDTYRKCKQIRHSEPKCPHAFHGCQVPGTNTQLTTAASQMHLCLPLWLSWSPIKLRERQLTPLIVVGTPGRSWSMWYSQRTLPEYGSFFHWTAILGTWWPSYVLKGIAKCHWCHPGECTKCASPRPRHGGTKRKCNNFPFHSVNSPWSFTLTLLKKHLETVEIVETQMYKAFAPTVSAKKCHESNSLQSRRCSADFCQAAANFLSSLGSFHSSINAWHPKTSNILWFLPWLVNHQELAS